MTAIISFEDGEMAYLATDGAAFSTRDGTIVSLSGKAVYFPALRLAIAATGKSCIGELTDLIQAASHSQRSLLDCLPQLLREVRSHISIVAPDDEAIGANETYLLIAAYLVEEQRPACLYIGTSADPHSPMRGEIPPFELHEHQGIVMPAVPVAAVLSEGCVVDAVKDTTALLKATRLAQDPNIPGGCVVGGACHLIAVGADEISWKHLLTFPEQVGERADPGKQPL